MTQIEEPRARKCHCGRPATNYWSSTWFCRGCFYRAYLKSSAWERRRNRLIRIRGKRCERCRTPATRGKNGNPTGLNVHHRTYDRLGRELDADLVVLCRACHEQSHGIVAL